MSELSPQDEAAVRGDGRDTLRFAIQRAYYYDPVDDDSWAVTPEDEATIDRIYAAVGAELGVLRGELQRRDELLAGFVNVVESCDLTVSDEEEVEPLLDLARRVIGNEHIT